MKKHHLVSTLRLLSHLADSRSSVPFFAATQIQNDPARPGSVLLRATNRDQEIRVRMPGSLDGHDQIAVPTKSLKKVIEAGWKPTDEIRFEAVPERANLVVSGPGKARVTLVSLPTNVDFPQSDDSHSFDVCGETSFNALTVLENLEWVGLALPRPGDTRVHLDQVGFDAAGRVWATDGHRIHIRECAPLLPIDVRLSTTGAHLFKSVYAATKPVRATLEVLGIRYETPPPPESRAPEHTRYVNRITLCDADERRQPGTGLRVEILDQKVDFDLPDVDQVLQGNTPNERVRLAPDATELTSALSFLRKLDIPHLQFITTDTSLVISGSGADGDALTSDVPARDVTPSELGHFTGKLDVKYLQDALTGIENPVWLVGPQGNNPAPVFLESDCRSSLAVVMPLRSAPPK